MEINIPDEKSGKIYTFNPNVMSKFLTLENISEHTDQNKQIEKLFSPSKPDPRDENPIKKSRKTSSDESSEFEERTETSESPEEKSEIFDSEDSKEKSEILPSKEKKPSKRLNSTIYVNSIAKKIFMVNDSSEIIIHDKNAMQFELILRNNSVKLRTISSIIKKYEFSIPNFEQVLYKIYNVKTIEQLNSKLMKTLTSEQIAKIKNGYIYTFDDNKILLTLISMTAYTYSFVIILEHLISKKYIEDMSLLSSFRKNLINVFSTSQSSLEKFKFKNEVLTTCFSHVRMYFYLFNELLISNRICNIFDNVRVENSSIMPPLDSLTLIPLKSKEKGKKDKSEKKDKKEKKKISKKSESSEEEVKQKKKKSSKKSESSESSEEEVKQKKKKSSKKSESSESSEEEVKRKKDKSKKKEQIKSTKPTKVAKPTEPVKSVTFKKDGKDKKDKKDKDDLSKKYEDLLDIIIQKEQSERFIKQQQEIEKVIAQKYGRIINLRGDELPTSAASSTSTGYISSSTYPSSISSETTPEIIPQISTLIQPSQPLSKDTLSLEMEKFRTDSNLINGAQLYQYCENLIKFYKEHMDSTSKDETNKIMERVLQFQKVCQKEEEKLNKLLSGMEHSISSIVSDIDKLKENLKKDFSSKVHEESTRLAEDIDLSSRNAVSFIESKMIEQGDKFTENVNTSIVKVEEKINKLAEDVDLSAVNIENKVDESIKILQNEQEKQLSELECKKQQMIADMHEVKSNLSVSFNLERDKLIQALERIRSENIKEMSLFNKDSVDLMRNQSIEIMTEFKNFIQQECNKSKDSMRLDLDRHIKELYDSEQESYINLRDFISDYINTKKKEVNLLIDSRARNLGTKMADMSQLKERLTLIENYLLSSSESISPTVKTENKSSMKTSSTSGVTTKSPVKRVLFSN